MINSTQTIRILSINESFDSEGVKIVSGECSQRHYSKDGVVEECLSYRAKGAPAMSISEAQDTGVAIGYLDLKVVDNGTYKSKKVCLVIRSFIPTTTTVESTVTTTLTQQQPQENRQLVGAGAATNNGLGRLSTTDYIPF